MLASDLKEFATDDRHRDLLAVKSEAAATQFSDGDLTDRRDHLCQRDWERTQPSSASRAVYSVA